MSEERFLSVLNEAKELFLEKLQAEEKLKAENGKFMEDIKQLKCENEKLSLENKRLTEKLKNSKEFVKVYFKDQLNRIKEIEKNGIFNAETFSYLVGDIGRSLYNTTLNETNNDPTTNKKPSQGRLSTNKENRRARYEDVEPSKDCRISWTTSNKNNKQTAINVGKWQDIFYNGKSNNEQHSNKNKQTLDSTTKPFSNHEHFKNLGTTSNKNFDQEIKTSKPQETQNFLDPDLTLCLPIGPPFKSSTQIESDKNKEKFNNTTQNPSKEILKNQKTIPNAEDSHFLDPDLTLRSPIGPPSKSSTPQGRNSGEEPKKFTLAFSPPPTSPSLLSNEDSEGCTLLPQIISMEGEVPEETQPKSPTILTRSHSFTRTTILATASPDHRTPKRKRNNMSFGSLLASEDSNSKQVIVNDSAVLGEHLRTRLSSDDESRSQSSKMPAKNHTLSPDIIVLDDSDFAKPNSTGVPRKKSKTSVANESALNTSSLLFSSPQTSNSPVPSSSKTLQSDNESNEMGGRNEEIDQQKPKIALNFNLDESMDNEKNPDSEEEKIPQYKYREVVRGKDKRAKLNGYFCADCEKYYGSLKLSEAEIQERLKACSRHRARFSPPPSTPEHFWQVDFMNTNEYIEKGYMRTESELPREKRKLKSRRFKLGKQQKS